jgi:hypothetical protein
LANALPALGRSGDGVLHHASLIFYGLGLISPEVMEDYSNFKGPVGDLSWVHVLAISPTWK